MTGVLVPVSGSVGTAGCRFFLLGWRGTPEGDGIGPGSGCRRGVFAVLWSGWRGTPEEGGIAPGVDAGGDVFEVLRGGCG